MEGPRSSFCWTNALRHGILYPLLQPRPSPQKRIARMFSSFRKLFAPAGSVCRKARPRPASRARLEALEDRLAPAVVTWVGGSGDWDTPSHWSTGSLPTPADDVQINTPGITVSHTQFNTDVVHSLTSKAALSITAGTLSLAASSSISGGLTLSGAILTGPGDLTLKGTVNWTSGTMSGPGTTTVAPGGTLNLNGGTNVLLDGRTLVNSGKAFWL